MNYKTISPITTLFTSIILFTSGFFILFKPYLFTKTAFNITSITIFILGILSIISYLFNKEKKIVQSLLPGIGYILLAIFIQSKTLFIEISITRIIGIYAFINFIIRAIASIILYKNKTKGWFINLLLGIVSVLFFIILFFNPKKHMNLITMISGIYLILYGITVLVDFFREAFDLDLVKDNLKRRIRITLPTIYVAFIPQKVLEKINSTMEVSTPQCIFVDSKTNEEGQLEIFIHLGPDCANGFGHVDICFEDKIYSYGTYDSKSNRLLKLVSDGVLIEANREEYIEFAIRDRQRYLVGFVLSLDNIQYNAIKNKIKKIKDDCIDWHCDAEKNKNKEYKDSGSLIYLATKAKFYKFKSGYFKTYFTLTSNCVKLADTIIGAAGLDAIGANGIITPGTYFNYLNNLFNKKNTLVIKRNIYKKISSQR